MKCPACNSSLKGFTINNIQLDACHLGCGGVWFDNRELKKFDETHEPSVNLDIQHKNVQKNSQPYSCPKCTKIKLFPRFSSVKRKVQVDECASCGGVWLDAGEISEIRNEFSTEADRTKAAEEIFNHMFDKDLAKAREKTEKELQSTKLLSNALKFVCPSWYIPGKQKGGAF